MNNEGKRVRSVSAFKLPPEWVDDLDVLKRLVERSAKINYPKKENISAEEEKITLKIATVSLGPALKDLQPSDNSKKRGFATVWVKERRARHLLRRRFVADLKVAARAGARLICFNEMAFPKAVNRRNHGSFLKKIHQIVEDKRLFLVAGSYHDLDTDHNVCPIFHPGKRAVLGHAKLTSAANIGEKIRTPAGREVRYYKTFFGKAGILICLDAFEPTLFLRMMKQSSPFTTSEDIDVIVVPAFSPHNSREIFFACEDLSYITGAIVVYVNCPEKQPRHAVFVAGQLENSDAGYERRVLSERITIHTIDLKKFRSVRNATKDSYSPILRYMMGDDNKGIFQAVRYE